jgi:hypothetical protein
MTADEIGPPTFRWQLTVTDSFQISGRGLVVVGPFEGHAQQRDPAVVTTGESS